MSWRDQPSASLSRNRARPGGADSQRETRYDLQVLHNIRLSSALFLAGRSIENCSVMMSRSPPVLTVLHSAFCGPHNSPPCPPVQAHLKHTAPWQPNCAWSSSSLSSTRGAFAPPECVLSDAPCMVRRLVSGRLHFSCDDALPVPLLFV